MVDNCDDNVRFTLSDDNGDLHFTAFDIVNMPECTGLVENLRAKLLGRPLEQIDVAEIQRMSCRGNGQCMQSIVRTIVECQNLFLPASGQCESHMGAANKQA